jgi:hypothetical protein
MRCSVWMGNLECSGVFYKYEGALRPKAIQKKLNGSGTVGLARLGGGCSPVHQ